MDHQVELLAPAGEPLSFYGAINAGADAVYLAGDQYGARAYAQNFSREELLSCLRYAHLLGKKIYLTVNTLMKEQELEELPAFLRPLTEEGLDGVIVQDLGAITLIRETFPSLPLHASTQMSVTGISGAKLLKNLGVVRIVPARELSLSEITRLKQESGMEIECFIHGAMCYCYSGQCLFSSVLGGRSGNRGKCAQPCRLPYHVLKDGKPGKECYPLSLKDMCTIEILPQILDAGVDSLKIEGRMKKPEYAAGVTAYYRKAIDSILEGKTNYLEKQDLKELNQIYLRSEKGTGYYFERNGRDMVTLSSPAYQASNEELLQKVHDAFLTGKKRLSIQMKACFALGKPASIEAWPLGNPDAKVMICGEIVEPASKTPIDEANVRKQLSKLGETPFQFETASKDLTLVLDQNAFYSLKGINELRRQALQALEEVILHG